MEKKISVVIPCYYSEKTIANIVEKVVKVMESKKCKYEIILVDDGSGDSTFSEMKKLEQNHKFIKCLCFTQNFGQHAALIAGYAHVTGDIVVGLNDDGEHNPEDLWALVDKIEEGYDYVCAKHQLKGHTFIQQWGSKINNLFSICLLGQPKNFYFSSYYAMTRELVKEIVKNKNPYVYINGIILSVTKNVAEVDIEVHTRKTGKSGYSLRKSIDLWLNSFTSFSVKPLRISAYCGGISLVMGVFCLAYILLDKLLFAGTVEGWIIVVGVMLILGGGIMLLLGMIGEYIGRIYMNINGMPQYVIRDQEKE